MKKIVFIAVTVVMLSACSTMQPPRYAISVDNIQKLKSYEGAKVEVVSLNQPANFNPKCRLIGPVELADGLTFSQFICKAFNDELKMANLYSKDGVKISGDITKIDFSSSTGVTGGYWDIGLRLDSSNGQNLSVSNKYTFKSAWDAATACNATANAFPSAIQDLIKTAINDPEFDRLIK
jgi:hypothetical protein